MNRGNRRLRESSSGESGRGSPFRRGGGSGIGRGFGRGRGRGRGRGFGRGLGRGGFSSSSGRREFKVGFYKLREWSQFEKEELATELYGNKEPFGKLFDQGQLAFKADWVRLILKILEKLSSASGEMMKKHIFEELSYHLLFWESTLLTFLNKQSLYGQGQHSMVELSSSITKILVELMRSVPSIAGSLPLKRFADFFRKSGDANNASKVYFISYTVFNFSAIINVFDSLVILK